MSDQAAQTPLTELARSVPKDLRAEWETQWFEDGTPCGHAMAPVGKYLHEQADEIERLTTDNKWAGEQLIKSGIEIERLTAENERLQQEFIDKAGEKAMERVVQLKARVDALEGKQHRIEQWCKAYPRTVFIEPTEEQWEWANQVLDADPGCPSLTAISGSNMRHVVEGIQALAATEQDTTTQHCAKHNWNWFGNRGCIHCSDAATEQEESDEQ